LGEVAVEVVVKEFRAVVGVEAEEGEGEGGLDILDLLEDGGFAFSPDGSLFGPAGGDIDGVEGIGEHAGEGIAAVGDGIGFEEAGRDSSHWLVLMGIWLRRRVPGLVVERPRFL
jgi:hypothetical protein